MTARVRRSRLSAEAFERCVVPYPQIWFGSAGDIVPVEGQQTQLASLLDAGSATDYIFREPNGATWGIAARCDLSPRADGTPYRTFTVRWWTASGQPAEWHRLRRAEEQGALGPAWHVHLCLKGGRFVCGAAIKTRDLLANLDREHASPRGMRTLRNSLDGARLLSLRWSWCPPDQVRVVERDELAAAWEARGTRLTAR